MLNDIVDAKLETVQDVATAYQAASRCLEEMHIDPFNSWKEQMDVSPPTSGETRLMQLGEKADLAQSTSSAEPHADKDGEASSSAALGDADDAQALLLDDCRTSSVLAREQHHNARARLARSKSKRCCA